MGSEAPPQYPLTHAGAYMQHGGYRLIACIEPDAIRRSAFMEHWNIPLGYASMEQALHAGIRADVVSICSPTDTHACDLRAVLTLAPRLIFCEKPLCPTLSEAAALVDECRARGVLLAVNHTRRWDACVKRLAQELHGGQWGRLRSATAIYNKGILNNGIHLIDLLLQLIGPMTINHVGTPDYDFWEHDPTIAVVLQTETGIPVMLNRSHARDYSLFELELVLERGVIVMEDGGLSWRIREAGPSTQFKDYNALQAARQWPGEYLRAMSAAVSNIFEVLTHGEALACDGETALESQRLCDRIHRQAQATYPGKMQ